MPGTNLYVFEGKKPEVGIISSLESVAPFGFSLPTGTIRHVFGANIRNLYDRLSKDEFQDAFSVIKESFDGSAEPNPLAGLTRSQVSSIFLFFDFDCPKDRVQEHLEYVRKLVDYFSNETEQGKLFVHYPMSEATRDFLDTDEDFGIRKFSIPEFTRYKESSGNSIGFQDSRKYTLEKWEYIIAASCYRTFLLGYSVGLAFSAAVLEEVSQQSVVFGSQANLAEKESAVCILSGFPLFLVHYFGRRMSEKIAISLVARKLIL